MARVFDSAAAGPYPCSLKETPHPRDIRLQNWRASVLSWELDAWYGYISRGMPQASSISIRRRQAAYTSSSSSSSKSSSIDSSSLWTFLSPPSSGRRPSHSLSSSWPVQCLKLSVQCFDTQGGIFYIIYSYLTIISYYHLILPCYLLHLIILNIIIILIQ